MTVIEIALLRGFHFLNKDLIDKEYLELIRYDAHFYNTNDVNADRFFDKYKEFDSSKIKYDIQNHKNLYMTSQKLSRQKIVDIKGININIGPSLKISSSSSSRNNLREIENTESTLKIYKNLNGAS